MTFSPGEATAAECVRSERRWPVAPAGLSGHRVTWPGVASLRPQLGWSQGHDKVTSAGAGCSLALGGGRTLPARLWTELVGSKGGPWQPLPMTSMGRRRLVWRQVADGPSGGVGGPPGRLPGRHGGSLRSSAPPITQYLLPALLRRLPGAVELWGRGALGEGSGGLPPGPGQRLLLGHPVGSTEGPRS